MEAKYVAGATLILVLVVTFGYYNNWFEQWDFAPKTELPSQEGGPTPPPGTPVPMGTFTVKAAAYDSLDITSALTLGTSVDVAYYAFRHGGWVSLPPYAAAGTDVEIEEVDGGYIYMLCTRHSTESYIFDAARTLAMSSRAVSAQFIDITGDQVKEFIVKYSMFNIPPAASGYPSTTFTSYFFAEDSGSASFPTGGQPADQTGIGTTQTTTFLPWYMSLSAAKKALAVYKVEVKVNTTSASKAELMSVNIPTRGVVAASSFDYQQTDSYQIWTYTIGQNLGDCTYWELPQNTNNKFDLTTSVRLTLATSDVLQWTCTIYELSAAQTTVVDADSAATKEA